MKFVSKISMAALILVGLAVSFVGCQKENEVKLQTQETQSDIKSPLTNSYPGLKYTQFSTADIPAKHLKNYTISWGMVSRVGTVCYVNNGTTTTTWRTSPSASNKTKAEALKSIPAGWRMPSRADFDDLYFACFYNNSYVQDAINFWYADGLVVPQYPDPIYVGYGYFWLSDVPHANTNLLAVNQPNGTTGLMECQVEAKAYVWAVR